MIDLTNKNVDEINALIQHYAPLWEYVKKKQRIPQLAVIIHLGLQYLNDKYADLDKDWKTWAVTIFNKLFYKIRTEADIFKIIDEFIEYYKTKYDEYLKNIDFFNDETDRDWGFVYSFILLKN